MLVYDTSNDDRLDPEPVEVTVNVQVGPEAENLPHREPSNVPVYVPDWDSFVGQEPLKAQLKMHIAASGSRCEQLDHVLLASGMPGVGKTTLARLIAQEMFSGITMLVPPFNLHTLREALEKMQVGDVLFIDEIHKLADAGKRGAEILLHIMEENTLYTPEGEVIPLGEFTLIGATTDADKLPEPLVDRFLIKPYFQPYSLAEMVQIAANFARYFRIDLPPEVLVAIAKASRRTPRVARELVAGARDLIEVYGHVTPAELLAFKEVEPDGLTRQHCAYLTGMYSFFGRERDGIREYVAGEASMMNLLRENKTGIARIERTLIEIGLLDRTPSGRRLTPKGIARARELRS